MKLLIVDDNAPMRRVIKAVVADQGHEIFECDDGSGALAAYREHQPDLVLMDLKMARMDGLAATRQIRQFFPESKNRHGFTVGRSSTPRGCARGWR